MHDIGLAIIYGVVQGLTEFLPVSSSGHLLLLHSIADLRIQNDLAFDVALHIGTLLAVVVYFFKDILKLVRAWLRSLTGRLDNDGRVAWWLFLATIPAALIGALFESNVEAAVRQPVVVGTLLIIGGVLLWLIDRWAKQQRGLENLGWKLSIAIGFGQALAIVPGVSRSGATIMIGRLVGLSREAAARFSFLLSIPIIAGAGAKALFDMTSSQFDPAVVLAGMAAAAIVGFMAIGWMLRYLKHASFGAFAVYRVVIGATALVYFLVRR